MGETEDGLISFFTKTPEYLGGFLIFPASMVYLPYIFFSMGEKTVRHLVAALATLIAGLAFFAGYISGGFGWWWTAAALFIVYGFVYRIIDAGGHH